MSIVFLDSVAGGDGSTRYSTYGVGSVLTGVTPSGGNAYRWATSGANELVFSPASSIVCGWMGRVREGWRDSVSSYMYNIGSLTTTHLAMTFLSGEVRFRLGSGTGTIVATSTDAFLSLDQWYFFEVRTSSFADSGGRLEVWIDGRQIIDFTGDTRNGTGSAEDVAVIRWGRVHNTGSGTWDVGQIYVANSTTPLGPCRPVLLLPNAVGNSSVLTPSSTGDNYLMVDEATPDGDTTYVYSATEGDKDTYGLTNLSTATDYDVLGVQTVAYAKKSDAGFKYMRPIVRTGGADYNGTSVALGEAYFSYMQVWDTNPGTTGPDPWTVSDINALEAGVEVRDS
jgi:hypothetical protein